VQTGAADAVRLRGDAGQQLLQDPYLDGGAATRRLGDDPAPPGGVPNAAPYSFFNAMGNDPPIVVIGVQSHA
jgi:hypothetical protein